MGCRHGSGSGSGLTSITSGRGKDKVGRADLVLLPWEIGFVTWQLTDIPLKPVTVNELTAQVKELFEQNRPEDVHIAENIEKEVQALAAKLDSEAIRDTLASLLGYYVSKSGELRVQRSIIIEGLKQWTVEACGLPEPPYISESFLEKIGFSDGRTKKFGRPRMETRSFGRENRAPWEQRGNVNRNRERMANDRREGERDRRSGGSWGDRGSFGGDRGSFGGDRGSFGGRDRGSYGDRERGSWGNRGDRDGDRPRRSSFGFDRSSTRPDSF